MAGSFVGVAVLVAGALALSAGGPAPVTFHVRYQSEGGSHQTYLDALQSGGVAGEAWLDSSEHDERRARTLTVCDRRADGVGVAARILVPDGRRIVYSASVGKRCFERVLGYPIVRWQLWFGGAFSGEVPAPPLV
ncbi:hypothetical protein [Cryptosporangium phraense]|uniref:Uncharacterized protein n=1 Tax=Cryptosporangium phraense TaxID=2593070 RepID=A0A545APP5_9ACTN|nr:hypothetical protein [Cryptosporangium phraense]TQS43276.1 hypothetical protein FL583_20785 [Cryptosporangium phraense]